MKIVQAVHSFPPAIGGIERHAYELCKALHGMGESVVVHTSGKGGGEPFPVKRHWAFKFPFFSSVSWIPFLAFRLMAEDADVYASHGYGALAPVCAAIAAKVKRKPFVFTVHGYPQLSGAGRVAQWIYRNTLARVIFWAADKVIVVSRHSIPFLEGQAAPEKIVHIPNGVDAAAFECPPFTEGEYFTYVGRLDKDKQVDMLIRAAAKAGGKEKILIAGNDDGAKRGLEALARKLNVDIEFTEVQPWDAGKIYCYSKAIVLPSRYEGFSLVWLEAMAAGRPMFSTPVGDAPDLFRKVYGKDAEKFLFPDEEGLVERIEEFGEKEKEYLRIVERAKEKVRREYSWEKMAEKTREAYLSAILEKKKK
ncbi:MAG: glycosyltransferase family 4 protein [Candidatus Bilamarchaeaceae archaeon]